MTGSAITNIIMASKPSKKTVIREVIEGLFLKIKAPFIVTPYAQLQDFHNLCCKFAIDNGYPMGTDRSIPSLRPFIPVGVSLASMAYGHIDEETRVFIAIYTAFLVHADDFYVRDNERLRVFAERFIRREKQFDLVLDALADFLLKIPDYYEPVLANIILMGALNLINACTLEFQTQGMKASLHAKDYPEFTRNMSGANEAFGVMIFPRSIPMQSYIQCIPDASFFLGHGNDVLSFYKEEVAHETANYISVFARCHGITPMEAFEQLANDVARAHEQVCKILEADQDAYQAWQKFKDGYVGFHISSQRYLINELMN
ncbi:isoprenoid synthase domain-containing protein [Pholiota molesta]|nr:isoprenoid synthase domain-containing protein [Pholiota molesta]